MVETQHERRQDERVTFRATAKLKYSENRNFDACETTDMIISGVFVEGVTGVSFGEKCEVEFHLYGRTSDLELKMAGETVRVQENGVALQFVDVDEDSFYHLQNIVFFNYKHSGQDVEIVPLADDVDDTSLYLAKGEGVKSAPLPDNYLDDIDEADSDDFDEESDEYLDRLKSEENEDSDY
jgi:hypothetical protein